MFVCLFVCLCLLGVLAVICICVEWFNFSHFICFRFFKTHSFAFIMYVRYTYTYACAPIYIYILYLRDKEIVGGFHGLRVLLEVFKRLKWLRKVWPF